MVEEIGTVQPVSEAKKPFNLFKFLLIGIVGLAIVVTLVVFLVKTVKTASAATISGGIEYTALKPDPEDRGQLEVKYRKYNSNSEYKTFFTSTPFMTAPWNWTAADSGQPYEIIADLIIDGKLVSTSEPLIVTAPADNQTLHMRVTWHDLPETVVKEQTASIKGNVDINGVVLQTSSLLIQAKAKTDTDFKTVVTLSTPQNRNTWAWEKAIPLSDYMIRAVLMDQGKEQGVTEAVLASGGDSALEFNLNSTILPTAEVTTQAKAKTTVTATPTPVSTQGTIIGTVTVNGPEQDKTSLLMLWRNPGDKDYKVISRTNNPSHNGQSWSFPNLKNGKQYEITAVLQVNDQNSASTQSQVVTAPAQNINFVLNTGVIIPTPDGRVVVNACNSLGNNQYNAIISFPRRANAGNYWLQVGRGYSQADIYNAKMTANTNDPQISIQVNGNQSYYAQYAYSLCVGCSEDNNFSNFSQSTAFSCGSGPAYTGYKCNTSNYSCQLTTDNNPPYSLNNAGLTQCQRECIAPTVAPTPTPTPVPTATPTPASGTAKCSETCGSAGLLCIQGLTCVSGAGVGSDVCRDPDCPLDTNCNCKPN